MDAVAEWCWIPVCRSGTAAAAASGRGGLAERSGLEIRRLLEPWRTCLRADGREVRRRNAAFSVDLWNGRRDRPDAAGRAGGDRSAGTGTGGEGQSDVVRPGCGSERGRIANRDGNPAWPRPSRIGAVAEGATDT